MSEPIRLVDLLPMRLREDDTLVRLVESFDDVLGPVRLRIDRLDRLAHPGVTPAPMVDWLCQWVGWSFPGDWPAPERRRALLAASGELLRWRGTARGLRLLIEVLGEVEPSDIVVADPGWVTCDEVAAGSRAVTDGPAVVVTISGATAQGWTAVERRVLESCLRRELPIGLELVVRFPSPDAATTTR